ncbi:hypothetical protein ACF0H5_019586 [Mactra antiquata]
MGMENESENRQNKSGSKCLINKDLEQEYNIDSKEEKSVTKDEIVDIGDGLNNNADANVKTDDVNINDDDADNVVVETEDKRSVPDGGWGWMIVIGCLLLRTVIGGVARSSGLFYLKFLERFGGTATQTSWVTSLSATIRLLTGLGRSFLLTPLTMLLGGYFDKRRSLAFGLASAGFGIGGFTITPAIEIMFQEYGFTGTYLLLSGIACNLFVCVCLFRSPPRQESIAQKVRMESETNPKMEAKDMADTSEDNTIDGENEALLSFISSTGSVHLKKANDIVANSDSNSNGMNEKKSRKENSENSKKKLFSFSVFKDIRFVTLCIATFIFTLPSSGLFLPALAKSRGLTDIQAAGLLSVTAVSDTVSRVIAGFVLDLKGIRNLRPYIYNLMSFIQCIASFCFPSLHSFEQFAAICALQGFVGGTKAAQRNVVLVDILGVDKLSSSFAVLLSIQGVGTLIGPPISALLKDYYGKYDYPFYLSGACVFTGALILASGNIRNYCNNKTDNRDDNKTE